VENFYVMTLMKFMTRLAWKEMAKGAAPFLADTFLGVFAGALLPRPQRVQQAANL